MWLAHVVNDLEVLQQRQQCRFAAARACDAKLSHRTNAAAGESTQGGRKLFIQTALH